MDEKEARDIAGEVLFQAFCQLRQHYPDAYEDLLDWADVAEEEVPEALKVLFADSPNDLEIIAEKSRV
jgi:hypothetical protein